ncbi:hypothetical protein [Comamonas jiangduensis]|uniref:hypothetical protein n=1 Tax=Comamonas jiangduensis TaxID=1194168 RepID=UPI0015825840|nr:hypothetical protein [Comamonas jiangduensis]
MSKTTPRTESSSPPGHQDQSARLAASAPVDQVGGTPTLEQFQRWLENRAHEAKYGFDNLSSDGLFESEFLMLRADFKRVVTESRLATALLMQFKLEQGA